MALLTADQKKELDNARLVPCRICQDKPQLNDYRTFWLARCFSCGMTIFGEKRSDIDHCDSDEQAEALIKSIDWYEVKKTAIDRWNMMNLVLPLNMKLWLGNSKEAPSDWDEGQVLIRDGRMLSPKLANNDRWEHWSLSETDIDFKRILCDIMAYYPKSPSVN